MIDAETQERRRQRILEKLASGELPRYIPAVTKIEVDLSGLLDWTPEKMDEFCQTVTDKIRENVAALREIRDLDADHERSTRNNHSGKI